MDSLRALHCLGMLFGTSNIYYYRLARVLLTSTFRWGTIPIVKVAQEERFIDLPLELQLPWSFFCRRYGVTSQGGTVTSLIFYNFDKENHIVYEINCCMPEIIKSAEYHFAHMLTDMEKLVCV